MDQESQQAAAEAAPVSAPTLGSSLLDTIESGEAALEHEQDQDSCRGSSEDHTGPGQL